MTLPRLSAMFALALGLASPAAAQGTYWACSSTGSECQAVLLNPDIPSAPPGYSTQEVCSYGTGCVQQPVYRGPTREQCSYGTGCVQVPAVPPRTETVCTYGTGCRDVPMFP